MYLRGTLIGNTVKHMIPASSALTTCHHLSAHLLLRMHACRKNYKKLRSDLGGWSET